MPSLSSILVRLNQKWKVSIILTMLVSSGFPASASGALFCNAIEGGGTQNHPPDKMLELNSRGRGVYHLDIAQDPVNPRLAYYYGSADGIERLKQDLMKSGPSNTYVGNSKTLWSDIQFSTLRVNGALRVIITDETEKANAEILFGPKPNYSLGLILLKVVEQRINEYQNFLLKPKHEELIWSTGISSLPEAEALLNAPSLDGVELKHQTTAIVGGGYQEWTTLTFDEHAYGNPTNEQFIYDLRAWLLTSDHQTGSVLKSPSGEAWLVWTNHFKSSWGGPEQDRFVVFKREADAKAYGAYVLSRK